METVNNNCHFKDMPDILLWLPVVSLLRFKSVCKSWYSLIESSEFVSQHLLHHHYHHPTSEDDFFISMTTECKAVLFPRNGENYKLSDIPHPYEKNDKDGVYVELIIPASCNGIICVYHEREQHFYLWNPARKQCRILPEKKLSEDLLLYVLDDIQFAIGFDDKTNDYKVVRLVIVHGSYPNSSYDHKIINFQLDIYSLSTDSWSVTEDFVLPVGNVQHIINSTKAPFDNGKYFCWLGEIDLDYNQICALPHIIYFDFSNEVLGTMPVPESVVFSYNRRVYRGLAIATLRDRLICIDYLSDSIH